MLEPSFEYLFFQILSQRANLSVQDWSTYRRLHKGYQGERAVAQSIAERGEAMAYATDLWLPARVQIDGVLATSDSLYLLEIKHYSGAFIYQGFSSLLNGYPLGSDIQVQVNRATYHLTQQLQHQPARFPKVEPLVIFSDPAVTLSHCPANFLRWAEWLAFLDGLRSDKASPAVIQYLQQFSGQNPHRPRSLSDDERQCLAAGLSCPQCGRLDGRCTRYRYHCPHCGFGESKAQAHLRNIYEFAILHHDEPIQKQALLHFLGHEASADVITRLCSDYLVTDCKGAHTKYHIDQPHHAYSLLLTDKRRMVSRKRHARME